MVIGSVEGYGKQVRRGGSFVLSNEMFENMLCDYLGFEQGSLMVRHVTTEHYRHAVKISVVAEDERFPVLEEGMRYPILNPICEVEVRESVYGINGTRIKFKGFAEFGESND